MKDMNNYSTFFSVKLAFIFSLQKQRPDVFFKKCVPKNFPNFTGKHLRWSLSLKFARFLRIPILKNLYDRLLLSLVEKYNGSQDLISLEVFL